MKRNNNWLWWVWFVLVAGLVMTGVVFAQGKEVVRVVKTEPANNQKDVSPDLDRIVVKFSSAMKTDSFSVVAAGQGETPEVIGSPEFTDEHTCVIKVRLKPATLYSIGFNSETRKGFQSKNGVPAKPFVLTFRTKETGSAGEIQRGRKPALEDESPASTDTKGRRPSGAKKTVVYKVYVEQTRGAFWVLIPVGWNIEGGIADAPFQSPKINFATSSQDGNASIRYIPGARYLHMPNNPFAGQGTPDAYGNIYLTYMEPVDYLHRVVAPNLYSSEVREVSAKELIDAEQALKRFYDMIGIAIPQIRCGALTIETSENGKGFLDRLIAYSLVTPMPEGIVWETQIIQVRVAKDKVADYEPILMTILSSFQLNPNWLVAMNKAEQQRAQTRMRYQQEILEIQDRMLKHRARTNEEISRSMGLELSNQAQFVDPKSGEVRTLSSSYDNTWTDGNGTFFQTSDPNLDPNNPQVQQELGLSGNFRKMKRR